MFGLQRLRQRDLLRVVAGEGGLQLVDDALAQPLRRRPGRSSAGTASAASRRCPRPCRSCAVELGRAAVEAAVDVDLLVGGRAVAAVVLGGPVERRLPCTSGSGRPACRRRWRRRPASRRSRPSACGQVVHEGRRRRDRRRASRRCRAELAPARLAHDVHQGDAVLEADPLSIWPRLDAAAVCTSAVWPSRRIVSTMPSAVSGLTKHDAPSAARRAGRQRQALSAP